MLFDGKLEASGYHIVMHIHDEVVVEVKDAGKLKAIENLMSGLHLGRRDWC